MYLTSFDDGYDYLQGMAGKASVGKVGFTLILLCKTWTEFKA